MVEANRSAELERRQSWAIRRGNPAWLWPEIDPADWRRERLRIGDVAKSVLGGRDCGTLEGCPEAIGLAAYTSGLGPMLGLWIERGRVTASPPIAEVLARHLDHNRRRMERLLDHAAAVTANLAAADIRSVVLKGAHTAATYFPERGVRPMSDIDLLIAADDAPRAADILAATGFVPEKLGRRESSWRLAGATAEPRSLLFVHADDPWSIDLHVSLDIDVAPGGPPARLDAARPLEIARPWPRGADAGCLPQPLLLLHLAVHAGMALHNLTLLRLVELALVIRRDAASGALRWDEFLALAEATGALGFAFPALALCHDLAADTVPRDVMEACRRAAPPRVVAVVAALTPATAQRVDRASIREHFMWAQGLGGWSRQLAADIVPGGTSWREALAIYQARGWRLLRGRLSR